MSFSPHQLKEQRSALVFISLAVVIIVVGFLMVSTLAQPSSMTRSPSLFGSARIVYDGAAGPSDLTTVQSAYEARQRVSDRGIVGSAYRSVGMYWSAFCARMGGSGYVVVHDLDMVAAGGDTVSSGTDYVYGKKSSSGGLINEIIVVCFNVENTV